MTASSSGWSPSGWTCAHPRRPCRPSSQNSRRNWPGSVRGGGGGRTAGALAGPPPGDPVRGRPRPALKALARRSPVLVELEVHLEGRLPAPVEVAAYYVIAEALTNAAKHANASVVHVDIRARAGRLRLAVEDDGVGGADPSLGTGLVGLSDRVQALGGTLPVHTPAGQGTRLLIKLVFDREDG